MAVDNSSLLELLEALQAAGVDDRIRLAAQGMDQTLIDAEAADGLDLRRACWSGGGGSTRSCALGADTGMSKSEVSRIRKDLDTEAAAFRDRSLKDAACPYVFLEATYCKARVNHRVVSQGIVVAVGVSADGRREVLGMDVGDGEDGALGTAFLRGLKTRGLEGVQLVISDAHAGLKQAIATKLDRMLPQIAAMMRKANDDLLAFAAFPQAHWRQTWSTNPSSAPTRKSRGVPTSSACSPTQQPCSACPDQCSSTSTRVRAASDRRYFPERSMALLTTTNTDEIERQETTPELMTA